MSLAEISRRINNLARFRTVTETKSVDGKALARVRTGEKSVSDFLPVMNFSNSFKRHWIPVRVNEQVLVVCPFGEADSGFIIRGIFSKRQKEPVGANNTTEVMEYEDGTVITYDTQAKELKINAAGAVNIICINATVTASTVDVKASTVDVTAATTHSGDVSIVGNLNVSGNISDSKGSLTGHVHTGVTSGAANTGTRP